MVGRRGAVIGAACSGCGDCCAPVVLGKGLDELPEGDESTEFARAHWHEMSFAEAVEMRPELVDGASGRFFRCDVFDTEARACSDYDNRPPVCQRFPWYGRRPKPSQLTDVSRCSYWADIAPEDVPVHIRVKV